MIQGVGQAEVGDGVGVFGVVSEDLVPGGTLVELVGLPTEPVADPVQDCLGGGPDGVEPMLVVPGRGGGLPHCWVHFFQAARVSIRHPGQGDHLF
jgi:hypothetical protein